MKWDFAELSWLIEVRIPELLGIGIEFDYVESVEYCRWWSFWSILVLVRSVGVAPWEMLDQNL